MGRRRSVNQRRPGTPHAWVYWGASGILQPLSEEFLYRSPAAVLSDSGSCRIRVPVGRRHVQD